MYCKVLSLRACRIDYRIKKIVQRAVVVASLLVMVCMEIVRVSVYTARLHYHARRKSVMVVRNYSREHHQYRGYRQYSES